jgi:ribose 5-phosphate isomerase B
MKPVYLGADHAGFALKEHLKRFLKRKGFAVKDLGAHRLVKSDDYPDYAAKVGRAVARAKAMGILACGSAEGICFAANKLRGIRAVPVWTLTNARLSRVHNDANVLCLSGWQLPRKRAERIVLKWLETPFSDSERHVRRIRKVARLERR